MKIPEYRSMSDREITLRRKRHYLRRHGQSTGKVDAMLHGLKRARRLS